FEQGRVLDDGYFGAAELTMMPALHVTAELVRHRLLAVTDAEHWHSGVVNGLGCKRCILVEDRSWAAGQNDRLRLHLAEGSLGFLIGNDFGIDLLLPHPARNELGHLGSEIDDQYLVVHGRSMCPESGRLGRARAVRGRFLRALRLKVKCPQPRPMLAANLSWKTFLVLFVHSQERHSFRNGACGASAGRCRPHYQAAG